MAMQHKDGMSPGALITYQVAKWLGGWVGEYTDGSAGVVVIVVVIIVVVVVVVVVVVIVVAAAVIVATAAPAAVLSVYFCALTHCTLFLCSHLLTFAPESYCDTPRVI